MTAPLIASLTPEALAALPEHRQAALRYLWPAFARPPQIPPEGEGCGDPIVLAGC